MPITHIKEDQKGIQAQPDVLQPRELSKIAVGSALREPHMVQAAIQRGSEKSRCLQKRVGFLSHFFFGER